jgi:methylmalonyl-CoA/ethylmalonyl-CoA epimerase
MRSPVSDAPVSVPAEIAPLVRGARLDHVAVAVRDLASGAALYRDVLGAEFLMGAPNQPEGFRFIQYRFPGGGKVELVTPTGDGFVSRFLERRGEGVHHITLRVQRIEEQVDRLRGAGMPLTLVSLENPQWKEAFIHPKDAGGVLVQLAESPSSDEDAARHFRDVFPEAALFGQEGSPTS